ncbi:Serine carboxypeptidase-like 16, partial [Mucuna pruriens]
MDDNARIEFAHQRTLISNELYEFIFLSYNQYVCLNFRGLEIIKTKSIKSNCNGDYVNLDPNNTKCMSDYEAFSELVRYINEFQILEPSCMITSKENQRILSEDFKNIPQTKFKCRGDRIALGELWANNPHVLKALQVREVGKQ